MNITPKQAKRFWSRVAVGNEDDCWLWLGGPFCSGYGCAKIGSQKDGTRQTMRAHRIACELAKGPVPDDKVVMHLCDVKKCCNPKHLSIGTHSENHKDAWAKNLRRGPKLSREQAQRIRETEGKQRDIAKHFGVCFQLVSDIKLGKKWAVRP